MQTIADQTKEDVTILIDGTRFVRVHFINCQLVYEAQDEVDFEGCTFERVEWTFADAAERMIAFLATLNAKAGDEGKSLVDAIVKSIKSGKVTQVRTVPASAAIARAPAHPATIVTK